MEGISSSSSSRVWTHARDARGNQHNVGLEIWAKRDGAMFTRNGANDPLSFPNVCDCIVTRRVMRLLARGLGVDSFKIRRSCGE